MWPISEFMNESRLRTCGSASLARPNNFHPEYFWLNGRQTGCLSRHPFKNTCRRFRPRCERFFLSSYVRITMDNTNTALATMRVKTSRPDHVARKQHRLRSFLFLTVAGPKTSAGVLTLLLYDCW